MPYCIPEPYALGRSPEPVLALTTSLHRPRITTFLFLCCRDLNRIQMARDALETHPGRRSRTQSTDGTERRGLQVGLNRQYMSFWKTKQKTTESLQHPAGKVDPSHRSRPNRSQADFPYPRMESRSYRTYAITLQNPRGSLA